MKTTFRYIIFLAAALGCSKDPAPLVGCQFTFKGVNYSFSVATCQTVAGTPALQSTSTTSPLQELILTQASTTPGIVTPVVINFHLDTNDANSFYSSSGAKPTVNVSGKTWNFNGTLLNPSADTGAISGACNCTN